MEKTEGITCAKILLGFPPCLGQADNTCAGLQEMLRCKMVPPWAEKCSKMQVMSCLWIFVAGKDLTDRNRMENVDTVLFDGLSS